MEPNNPKNEREPEKKDEAARPTYQDLHNEGIDIVTGSGISEENEFSDASAQEMSLQEAVAPLALGTDPVAPAPKPALAPKESLTPKGAALISSLQEIPKAFIRPEKPLAAAPQQPPAATFTMKPQTAADDSKNDPSIKSLRTFKSDAEEAVRYQNISAVDIALAQEKKRQAATPIQYEKERHSHAKALVFISLLAVVILAGGWYYWFSTSQSPIETKRPSLSVPTMIPYAKISALAIDPESDPLTLVAAKLAADNAGLGNVYALIPLASATATAMLPLDALLAQTDIPNRLARSLSGEYMIGVYTYEVQSPFLILRNTFFQNAFAGMLEWEKDLRNDLLPLILVAHPDEQGSATGQAFEDVVVSNIDARALKNEAGEVVILYAFADKDTIVVSMSTNGLKYIIDKLLAVRTIQ